MHIPTLIGQNRLQPPTDFSFVITLIFFFLDSQLPAFGCGARCGVRGAKPISTAMDESLESWQSYSLSLVILKKKQQQRVFAVITLNEALHKSQLVFSPTQTLRVNTNITLQCRCRHMGCYAVRAIDPKLSSQIRLRW